MLFWGGASSGRKGSELISGVVERDGIGVLVWVATGSSGKWNVAMGGGFSTGG